MADNDLFCNSKYPIGWVPEMGSSAYPITSSVLFGLSVKFYKNIKMKRTFIILLGCCLGLNSCYELDLNPLSQASSENWYSNETEIEMSIKDFYRDAFWPLDNEDKTDNFIYRETPSEII